MILQRKGENFVTMDYEAFDNAEQIWLWFCGCLMIQKGGLRSRTDYLTKPRNIEISDIQCIVKRLDWSDGMTKVMFKWGMLGYSPNHHSRATKREERLWDLGIGELEKRLISKKIL